MIPPLEPFNIFTVTYLTETVSLDPGDMRPRQRGLIAYSVFAKNAEDAILRLREQESLQHPIIEIASVVATDQSSEYMVMPREWGIVTGGSVVGREN